MKNGYLKITLPLMLAMTSLVTADAKTQTQQMVQEDSNVPMYQEYHNRIAVFEPLHQCYERIKTDAFYVGIEAWAGYVFNDEHQSFRHRFFGESELRMGYNFFYNGRDHVTPFLGIGVFKDFRRTHEYSFHIEHGKFVSHHHHGHEAPAVGYGVFGLLYDHEFNSIFNLGVNFKGFVGGSGSDSHLKWGNPVGGIDVSLPITFRFGPKRHWDIRLEPFYIYVHGSHHSRNYFGSRGTVGYRF